MKQVFLASTFGIDIDPKTPLPFEISSEPRPMTPAIDTEYVFDRELLQKGIIWQDACFNEQNLLLTGPTGAGKTSFIEQLCARLNLEVWRILCHGRMEFQELVGGFRLVADGKGGTSTDWVDGPLTAAARAGGTLLLDEGNFISPAAFGGLNAILDGAPILIPETGEMVRPAPGFRVAFTGNSVNNDNKGKSYRGTQTMNIALLDRFMVAEVDYMSELSEAVVLNKAYPQLTGDVIKALLHVANGVRQMHKKDEIETTMSTRVVLRWAKLFLSAPMRFQGKDRERALWALDLAHLRAIRPMERDAIQKQVELIFA